MSIIYTTGKAQELWKLFLTRRPLLLRMVLPKGGELGGRWVKCALSTDWSGYDILCRSLLSSFLAAGA